MVPQAETAIEHNLLEVRGRIASAANSAGRSPSEVLLIAVSKTFPAETVLQAAAAGQSCFGENRIQEAEGKIHALRGSQQLEWHLVGHLQSNKARRAAELFDVIHSLDNVKLAERLSQACRDTGKVLSVLVQVDLGHETTKSGVAESLLRELVHAAASLPGLRLDGLMTIPPFFDDPQQTRPYFAELRAWKDLLEKEKPGCLGRRHLSMGMTHDFEIAIQEGATMVRIGTAIFGSRSHA